MNLDRLKDFIHDPGRHDLPAAAAVLVGMVLLCLVFKSGKFFMKLVFFLLALAALAGAVWWYFHPQGRI